MDKQTVDAWLVVQEWDEFTAETDRVMAEIRSALDELNARQVARREAEQIRVPGCIICPRCRAIGRVTPEVPGYFRVDWWRIDGWVPSCFEKAEDWFDLGLKLADLKRSTTGCGYDSDENPGCSNPIAQSDESA